MEIGRWQLLHLPRNNSQLIIGMFSLAFIWCPHLGHRDRGRMTDSPSGHRPMQTLRNEPIAAPTTKAYSPSTISIISKLVKNDSGSDCHVQGLDAARNRQ